MRQSESNKNLLVNFNKVHTMSDSSLLSSETSLSYSERSSHPEVFCTKDFLKNFAKFAGKHLCQSHFFNKVADFRPANLLKKTLWHRFPCGFCKIFKNNFFTEHLQWLLVILTHFRSSRLNVFLEISQNSQENTCASFSFLIKLWASGLWILGNMYIVIVIIILL